MTASTQNQALSAPLCLYRNVLAVDLPWLDDVVGAKRLVRRPVVLRSNPHIIQGSPFTTCVSCVEHPARFNQK